MEKGRPVRPYWFWHSGCMGPDVQGLERCVDITLGIALSTLALGLGFGFYAGSQGWLTDATPPPPPELADRSGDACRDRRRAAQWVLECTHDRPTLDIQECLRAGRNLAFPLRGCGPQVFKHHQDCEPAAYGGHTCKLPDGGLRAFVAEFKCVYYEGTRTLACPVLQ